MKRMNLNPELCTSDLGEVNGCDAGTYESLATTSLALSVLVALEKLTVSKCSITGAQYSF